MKNNIIRLIYSIRPYINFSPIKLARDFFWYVIDVFVYKSNNKSEKIHIYPCLSDKTQFTPVDPVYFYQDTWAARKIFLDKPKHHYDIGSAVKFVGIISQFTPVTMVDIRPLEVELDNLNFIEGNILNLPFEDNSIESLSSLCVVEHIGLGRYGDKVDANGTEKSIEEITRVMKPGGKLLISVPVDSERCVYFNAHRAFDRDYILNLLDEFSLLEEKYQYGNRLSNQYDPGKGFGTGLFQLKKIS